MAELYEDGHGCYSDGLDVYGDPCYYVGGSWDYGTPPKIYNPNVTVTPQGVQVNTTPLDKILNSTLSFLALLKGAKGIPTTTSVYPPQPVYNPTPLGQLPYNNSGGNTLGGVEQWLKNNTGVALMAGAAIVLFYMKPPSRSR